VVKASATKIQIAGFMVDDSAIWWLRESRAHLRLPWRGEAAMASVGRKRRRAQL
jgi:hypothetical protein